MKRHTVLETIIVIFAFLISTFGWAKEIKEVDIEGFSFKPESITVEVGEPVRWTMKDATIHTVTSGVPGAADAGNVFDSGNLSKGDTFGFTFNEAGAFKYFCEIHPYMRGEVVVEKKPLTLEQQLIEANEATRKFKNVEVAKANGYVQVSAHVPKMGIHFLNQKLVDEKFEHTAPEVLLYVQQADGTMKLAGIEFAVPGKTAPEGFTGDEDVWEVHEAACHYVDGTEIKKAQEKNCPEKNPETGAEFASWHPDLQTLHVWLYIKNPDGHFAPFNPAVERTVTAVSPSGKLSFIWGALKAR